MSLSPNTTSPARPRGERRLAAAAILVAAIIASPILAVFLVALTPNDNIWPHLLATVLPGYALTTLELMAGVGAATFAIGTGAAWLVTMYAFPARRVMEWVLIVPLAMPTYIIAYAWLDVLDYAGPVQSALRAMFGWQSARDYWFPDLRSLGGAVFVMAFVLYPYVYLTARAAFILQSQSLIEASRMLGRSMGFSFLHIALPLARPAIVVGIVLAMMETLNDLGAVQYYGVGTLTSGVYATWLQKNNLAGAAQVAAVMLAFVFALILLERHARSRRAFHQTTGRLRPPARVVLTGPRRWAALALCLSPVVIGFVIPAAVLMRFALARIDQQDWARFADQAANSLMLSSLAAVAAVVIALFLAHAARTVRMPAVRLASTGASVGYAVPGTVLAIGILVPLTLTDTLIDEAVRAVTGLSTGLIFSGTMFAIVFAYVVRFMAVAHGAIDAGYQRLSPSLAMAARSLGRGPFRALREVQLPLMRPAIVAAALLVFVDSMKELPATLLLRPFNFDTHATHVYTYASLAIVEEAALSALAIVAVGIVPVLVLNRSMALAATEVPVLGAVAGTGRAVERAA